MSAALVALLAVAIPGPEAPAPALRIVPEAIDISAEETVDLVAPGLATTPGVAFAVEAGTLQPLPSEGGALRARWRLPADLMPRRLAAALVDTRTGTAAFALLTVSRRARLRVNASPHARVRLRSQGRVVAEGVASARGKLELSVVVPPAMDLEGIEQELAGKSDAVGKLRELGLRNELHVVGFPAGVLVPDGKSALPLALLAYSDDGVLGAETVTAAIPDHDPAPAQAVAPGHYATSLVAGPWRDGPPPTSLPVTLGARRGSELTTATVTVPLSPLAPVALELEAPQGPLRAGEVYQARAVVLDAGGRVMSEAVVDAEAVAADADAAPLVVLAAGVAEGGGRSLVLQTPRSLPRGAGAYTLRARVRGTELGAELPLALVAGPPASLVLASGRATEEGVELAIALRDHHGNPARGSVALEASAGRVGEPRYSGPGELTALWEPPDPRRSAQATVDGTVIGTTLRGRTVVAHQAPPARLGIGTYAGVALDGVAPVAPTLTLAASLEPPGLPEGLGLLFLAGVGRGTWSQELEESELEVELTRTSLLAPVTAGLEWRWAGGGVSLGLGAGTGVLVTGVSSEAREEEDHEPGATSTLWSAGWLWRAGLRAGVGLGPGELSLLAEVWEVVNGTSTHGGQPRAASLGLGYVLAITP